MLLNSLSPPLRRLQRCWSNSKDVRRCLSRYLIFCADTWSLKIRYIARFSGWWICRQWLPVYESSTTSNILRSHPVPTRESCVSWAFPNDSSGIYRLIATKRWQMVLYHSISIIWLQAGRQSSRMEWDVPLGTVPLVQTIWPGKPRCIVTLLGVWWFQEHSDPS